jgi:hypothetical protein
MKERKKSGNYIYLIRYIYVLFQMDKFEIESCIKWIQENNFHIIALQVPDDDLDKVQDLIDVLTSSSQNENIEFFLVGDGCSPCCNDLLNAQYCQAQGLIHFGHSCLTASSEDNEKAISIFYVFYQQSLPYVFRFFYFYFLFVLGKMLQPFSQQTVITKNRTILFSTIHVFVMLSNSIQHYLVLFSQKLIRKTQMIYQTFHFIVVQYIYLFHLIHLIIPSYLFLIRKLL